YILKPFVRERLEVTVQRIKERKKKTTKNRKNLETLLREQMLRQSVKKIPVWDKERILLLNPYEVIYFTVKDGEVLVISSQGRYYSRESLTFWEDRLKESRFFRTHKKFLVNLDKVRQVIPFFNYTYLLRLEGVK